MNLYDLVSEADLQRGMDEKLINVRYADDGQKIYNYSDLAMFTPGAWDNPAVRICRGLIVAADGRTVVARSWAKFFNSNQAEAGSVDLDAQVEVTDKMDGSLGIIHRAEDGNLRVSTRGSFESDQAIWATDWLRKNQPVMANVDKYTYLVEIIYPENRIVCNYGDFEGLVLLGAVATSTGGYLGPLAANAVSLWNGEVTKVFPYETLREALEVPPRDGAEGFCVRILAENKIVKIKQEDYIALHKIVTGLSERSIWEHMVEGLPLDELLSKLPDELHEWTQGVWLSLHIAAHTKDREVYEEKDRIVSSLPDGWTRGDFAREAKKSENWFYLFLALDGKDVYSAVLKNLKPEADQKAKTFTEATA